MSSRGLLVGLAGVVLAAGFMLFPQVIHAQETATSTTATTTAAVEETDEDEVEDTVHDAKAVEKKVRSLFDDAPVMAEIARCESKFRQYTDSGNVLRGGANGAMIGVFQFNEDVHDRISSSLGFDINTLAGNLSYAEYVYKKSGTDPWISSFGCWNSSQDTTDDDSSVLNVNLSFGQMHSQVRTLQQLLNKAGFIVADSGPGSAGNETTMFGNLTRAAVRKFQCEKKIACDGSEYPNGYGLVDKKTRIALLAYQKGDSEVQSSDKPVKEVSKKKTTLTRAKRLELEARIKELTELLTELQRLLAERRSVQNDI